ncbi:MAG: transketolase [Bdellovibrionaceae bacterium]|nr:transketolase [Bdellovibrio sp.]
MTQITPLQVKNHLAGHQNKKPQFAKKIKLQSGTEISVADPKATRALVALMDMNAVLGGAASHYGGPAALAELMSALHGLVFNEAESKNKNWFELAHIINDAGHCENGLYALKANYEMAGLNINSLKKFRSIESGLTGHGEVHCFPEGVYLSNGPLGSAFPQSQGLALAEKLAGTNRITYCVLSDGAAMEGEAKESLAAVPGLAKKGQLAPYVLIISDNNTKLSGRIDQDSFSMEPTFNSLEVLGWKVIKVPQGNDLQACASALESATEFAKKNPTQPVAVWAKTTKGIGTKKTAESASGGHGFPCKSPTELADFIKEIYANDEVAAVCQPWIEELIAHEKQIKAAAKPETGEKIQIGISKAMVNAFKKGLPVLSVTSDLPGSTGVAGFRKEFPQASIDVGVAESNMISTAAGLSKQGFIPVVDTFAQFGVTKGALPLTMAMLSEAPIIGVFSHTGFQDAADGASHQALSYMSMLATIPGVDLYSLSSSEEAEALMSEVLEKFAEARKKDQHPHSSIFFLGRENFPKTFKSEENKLSYKAFTPQVLKNNFMAGQKNVVLMTTGSLVGEALQASELLKTKKIGSFVVNQNCLNKIELGPLKDILSQCEGRIVTAEDHQVLLGFGAFVTHQLMQDKVPVQVKSLGVHSQFGQSAYNAIELYKKHGVDSTAMVKAAIELD